jgi:hypothetical protein
MHLPLRLSKFLSANSTAIQNAALYVERPSTQSEPVVVSNSARPGAGMKIGGREISRK